jgi:hypothetical protein
MSEIEGRDRQPQYHEERSEISPTSIPEHGQDELRNEKKGIQAIVEHLRDAELESARFQAFADYADRENELSSKYGDAKMIDETIRQRINGMRRYKKEHDLIPTITSVYNRALMNRLLGDKSLPALYENRDPLDMHRQLFATTLQSIKSELIDKKSQQSETSPNK